MAANPTALNRERARAHYEGAGNMTDAIGGLCALMEIGGEPFDQALTDFYQRWRDEPLVIDKWFALQARDPSEGALGRVLGLTAHPAFDPHDPESPARAGGKLRQQQSRPVPRPVGGRLPVPGRPGAGGGRLQSQRGGAADGAARTVGEVQARARRR